jgi:hypothetical protein
MAIHAAVMLKTGILHINVWVRFLRCIRELMTVRRS